VGDGQFIASRASCCLSPGAPRLFIVLFYFIFYVLDSDTVFYADDFDCYLQAIVMPILVCSLFLDIVDDIMYAIGSALIPVEVILIYCSYYSYVRYL